MKLSNKKTFALPLAGVLLLGALGIGLVGWPEHIIGIFPPLIGVVMMLVGAQGIAQYFALREKLPDPGIKLVQSMVTITVGLVFLLKRDVSLAFLAMLFGLYAIISAAVNLSSAVSNPKSPLRERIANIAESALGGIFGLLLLFAPFSGRSVWARFLGVYFVFTALHGALLVRKVAKLNEETPPQEDTPQEH